MTATVWLAFGLLFFALAVAFTGLLFLMRDETEEKRR